MSAEIIEFPIKKLKDDDVLLSYREVLMMSDINYYSQDACIETFHYQRITMLNFISIIRDSILSEEAKTEIMNDCNIYMYNRIVDYITA